MTRKTIITGFVNLAWIALCSAVAIAVVLGLQWGLHHYWPQSSLISGLIYGLLAPFGVVLFALLVEQASSVTSGSRSLSRLGVRYTRLDVK